MINSMNIQRDNNENIIDRLIKRGITGVIFHFDAATVLDSMGIEKYANMHRSHCMGELAEHIKRTEGLYNDNASVWETKQIDRYAPDKIRQLKDLSLGDCLTAMFSIWDNWETGTEKLICEGILKCRDNMQYDSERLLREWLAEEKEELAEIKKLKNSEKLRG